MTTDLAFFAGRFIGAFSVSLGLAAIWLIIAMVIPPLRNSPKASYGIAMFLATAIQFVNINGLTIQGALSIIVCNGLLFWQMKRAQSKLNQHLMEKPSVEP